MRHNGLGIGEEWDFEKQKLISVPKFNSGRMLKCSTSAHFLPMQCYAFALFIRVDFQQVRNYFKNK